MFYLLGFEALVEEPASLAATKPAPFSAAQILSFTGGQTLHYATSSLTKRMTFVGNPATGDASVSITAVEVGDTATYQCKVKKAPGVDMRKVTLVVLGEHEL